MPSRCARTRANLGRSFAVDSVASRSADLFRRQAKLQVQLRNLPLRLNRPRNRILLTPSSHLTLRAKAREGFRWGWHIRLRGCGMLHKIMPPCCTLLFVARCCFSQGPPGFTCQKDCIICYTKSVGGPLGGRVVCPTCREGSC